MQVMQPSQLFPRPENDGHIMASWERFLNGERAHGNALRRLIDDSWQRCLDASVDPSRYQAPEPLGENSLYSLRTEHHELLTASTPVMAEAREFLSETGTVMVLTDHQGTILSLEGDSSTSTRGATENVHLLPGSDWSENACGTNAIGTALTLGQPVQIHSAEHFCAGIKRWTCSATVIRDPYDNRILGVIDVSGLNGTYNRHSLALVVTTAGRIENRLARIEMDYRYRLLEQCMRNLATSTADGLIVLDRRGLPIKANERASAVLAGLGEDVAGRRGLTLNDVSLGVARGDALPDHLPDWIRPEWLAPVMHNGQRIGTLLTLPNRSPASFVAGGMQEGETGLASDKGAFARVIGQSRNTLEAVARARQLARSNVPVLMLGETGVGKDVFARCMHEGGSAKDGPFVALNCGGFSRELLTSELFGYTDGAFTGARRGGMIGKVEAADGGTLFLDEIGEMPLDLQPHFLRVLEEGEVYRLGENKPRKVKFRLIAATNRDLRKEVEEGRFRMDLFYRVAVTSVHIPPLRERIGDIPLLADYYLERLAQQHGVRKGVLLPGTLEALQAYAWPGNIREFRNIMESMLLTAPDHILGDECLPPEILGRGAAPVESPSRPFAQPQVASEGNRLEDAERDAILKAIRNHGGNMAAVARALGIAKSTLYLKLKRFDLDSLVDSVRSIRN
ncbi:sigma-54-dependent Fis family transcriptional regulator [Azoarcus sp. KH32C]|uniref:sigma-54-dependent Fis family transcriptional regulator n=1 Tax=Azoarcus sp. KH32C TaxID=748247 RepID=UPI0002386CB6|nr:sigma-54-dependent Fis family transcriptional regulator [Azoarcus sp. KH32C]BAL25461.1 sigma-54 dependent activator protein [Azoarcus sp. KH32C]